MSGQNETHGVHKLLTKSLLKSIIKATWAPRSFLDLSFKNPGKNEAGSRFRSPSEAQKTWSAVWNIHWPSVINILSFQSASMPIHTAYTQIMSMSRFWKYLGMVRVREKNVTWKAP